MMRISRRLSNAIHPHFAFSRFRVFAVDFFGLTRWNPITMLKSRLSSFIVFFLARTVFLVAPLGAQEKPPAARERQRALIETLRTGTAAEKALACKALAVYGDKEAVPALASLLTDGQLNSWARIALEAIDDPAAARRCARRWAEFGGGDGRGNQLDWREAQRRGQLRDGLSA